MKHVETYNFFRPVLSLNFLVFLLIIFVSIFICFIKEHNRNIINSISNAREQLNLSKIQQQQIELELSTIFSAKNIASKAKHAIGMKKPNNEQVSVINYE